jgi:hypothetical protein
MSEVEPEVSLGNWSIRPNTRDAVHVFDELGRKIATFYRVGRYGHPGGSEPTVAARHAVQAVNALVERKERKPLVGEDKRAGDTEVQALRAECDELGIKWHFNHGALRLRQLIEAANDPNAKAKRDTEQRLPRGKGKGFQQEASKEVVALRKQCEAAGLKYRIGDNEQQLTMILKKREGVALETA